MNPVYDSFFHFAVERMNIFWRRLRGDPWPWTDDSILREYKFTNCYRVLDRTTQYLIRNVIEHGRQDWYNLFFRTVLFKLFNKIETWEILKEGLGATPSFENWDFHKYEKILRDAFVKGKKIYSAAYIMPPVGPSGNYKHQGHLRLLHSMLEDGLPSKIALCDNMGEAFRLLKDYKGIGDFLAYQLVTDLNYSTMCDFTEMEFVVPGPGAKDGITKCFGPTKDYVGVIDSIVDRFDEECELRGMTFPSLFGHELQYIDIQNLFCEISKYARVKHPTVVGTTGRTKIKQKFKPVDEKKSLVLPAKWKLNTNKIPDVPQIKNKLEGWF